MEKKQTNKKTFQSRFKSWKYSDTTLKSFMKRWKKRSEREIRSELDGFFNAICKWNYVLQCNPCYLFSFFLSYLVPFFFKLIWSHGKASLHIPTLKKSYTCIWKMLRLSVVNVTLLNGKCYASQWLEVHMVHWKMLRFLLWPGSTVWLLARGEKKQR